MYVATILTDTLRTAAGRKLAVMIGKDIEEFPENADRLTGTIDIWWIVRILYLKYIEMLECYIGSNLHCSVIADMLLQIIVRKTV